MNLSIKNSVSLGPGQPSGWNWTAEKGPVVERMPSMVPSLALINQGSQPEGRLSRRTAYPWFWLVM
jgi:hypothetical protein